MRIRRSLALVAVAALPLGLGMGTASAEGVPAGQDRLHVDSDADVTDLENLVIDVRVVTVDDDGDSTGIRSKSTSSDVADLENTSTDNRLVTSDRDSDATSSRVILGVDDLSNPEKIDSDIDAANVEGDEQHGEDAEFVFGSR